MWMDHLDGLAPVGVIGAFPMARRRELFAELQPLVVDVADHPWSWAADMGHAPEGGSRWNPKKISRSCCAPSASSRCATTTWRERASPPPQFVRWRPDREPASCGYAQLEQPTPFELADVLAIGRSSTLLGEPARAAAAAPP